jgi:hypothetical protein
MSSNEEAIKRKYAANAAGDDAYESYGTVPAVPVSPPPPPPSDQFAKPVAMVAPVAAQPSSVSAVAVERPFVPDMTAKEIVIPDRFCKYGISVCLLCASAFMIFFSFFLL